MSKRKKTLPPQKNVRLSRWHAAPLKGSFMITSMLGFLISVYWVYPQSTNFGLAFMLVFAVMFFASIVSMTKSHTIILD